MADSSNSSNMSSEVSNIEESMTNETPSSEQIGFQNAEFELPSEGDTPTSEAASHSTAITEKTTDEEGVAASAATEEGEVDPYTDPRNW